VMDARRTMNLCSPSKRFYVFGHPVALSASPIIQNVGFEETDSPHSYYRYDTPYLEDVVQHLSLASTGGASITVPHKVGLVPYMHELSEAAEVIGAVNTVTVLPDGRWRGDNTDWIGITGQLGPLIEDRDKSTQMVALIVGAGGTARAACYAFQQMGFGQVYIQNRTYANGARLAQLFNALSDTPRATKSTRFQAVETAESLESLDRLDAVMGTIPGSGGFVLPNDGLLLRKYKPVVIDAAYESSKGCTRVTALLEQAAATECRTVEGMEMLFEQGCAQSTLWTGKPAPRAAIAKALLKHRYADDNSPPRALVVESS